MYKIVLMLTCLLTLLQTSTLATSSPPFTLTAALKQSICREGQPVILDLALRNNGPQRLGYFSDDEQYAFQITVTNEAGRPVPYTAFGDRALSPSFRGTSTSNILRFLEPTETLLYQYNLDRLFDLSRIGTYKVSVSRFLQPDASSPAVGAALPQKLTLAVSSLKVQMEEDAADPAPAGPFSEHSGQAADGLVVSVGMADAAFVSGTPVVLWVTLQNVTKYPMRLGALRTDLTRFHLRVDGPQRHSPNSIGPGGEPVAGEVPLLAAGHELFDVPSLSKVPIILPAGEKRYYKFVVSRLADLTIAGNYTVQIVRTLPNGKAISSLVVPFLVDGHVRDRKYSVQLL